MIEHLNTHTYIQHAYCQQRQSLQHIRILRWLPQCVEISSISRQKCNGNAHNKNQDPIAALDNIHQLFLVTFCVCDGDLGIEDTHYRAHQAGDSCRYHFCQRQHGHGSTLIQDQRT